MLDSSVGFFGFFSLSLRLPGETEPDSRALAASPSDERTVSRARPVPGPGKLSSGVRAAVHITRKGTGRARIQRGSYHVGSCSRIAW